MKDLTLYVAALIYEFANPTPFCGNFFTATELATRRVTRSRDGALSLIIGTNEQDNNDLELLPGSALSTDSNSSNLFPSQRKRSRKETHTSAAHPAKKQAAEFPALKSPAIVRSSAEDKGKGVASEAPLTDHLLPHHAETPITFNEHMS